MLLLLPRGTTTLGFRVGAPIDLRPPVSCEDVTMTTESWRVTVMPEAAMVLHRRFGKPHLLTAIFGFWGTLHAERGQLRLVGHSKLVAVISDIEHIGTDLVVTGRGGLRPAIVVTIAGGEKLPMLPFDRPGFLPHASNDPAVVAAEIRATVCGDA